MRAGDAAGARLVLGESDDTEPNTANNLSPSPPHPALATAARPVILPHTRVRSRAAMTETNSVMAGG